MLFLLRLIFGFALFAVFAKAVQVAGPYPLTDGPTDAGYAALAAVVGIANAVVWAPYIGRLMAEPLTGAFTSGHPGDYTNHVVQFIHKLALRRRRRLALFFAFLEGVRHPDLPAAFVLGLGNARPGSWLEKAFAREVWRFDNAENCLRAWRVLRARGIDPGLHRAAEVNLLILSADREKRPEPGVLAVPPAPPPPPPVRNPRIRLFDGAAAQPRSAPGDHGVAEPAGTTEVPSPSPNANASGAAADAPTEAGQGGAIAGVGAGAGTTGPLASSPAPLSWRERWRILRTGRIHE